MKLSRAVEQFIEETRMSKAKATAAGYGSDLHYLVTLARPDSVLAYNDTLVTQYFLSLSGQGLSMSSLHRKATALNQFSKWGLRKRLWANNPMEDPKFHFRRPDSLPRAFDSAEVGRIMGLSLSGRQAVVRALLYYTGLRVSPVCAIRVGDISFAPLQVNGASLPGSIRTLSKGGRQQLVPMAPELAIILEAWLEGRQGGYEPVLMHQNGTQINRKTVERMTHQWGLDAGVTNCIPHRFRHTYATDLRRQGVALDVIQRLLGHSSIATTQVYARVADEEVVRAVLTRQPYAAPAKVPVPGLQVAGTKELASGSL